MAEFLKGSELNSRLEGIFEQAERKLLIISPYIKLHPRLVDILKLKRSNPHLSISVVFGKNQDNISKSINTDDFFFLKEFANIQIRYEERLHAKYYANEKSAILSSMNLYDFSQNNNIEFGIFTARKTLVGGDALDTEAFNYFDQVVENSSLLYSNTPKFEGKLLGLSSNYLSSEVEVDKLSSLLDLRPSHMRNIKGAPKESNDRMGYCIRTGVKIPFNPDHPLSEKAYQSWSKYGDKAYKEKYCHFSGEESHGETSFERPILRKNWNTAMKVKGR